MKASKVSELAQKEPAKLTKLEPSGVRGSPRMRRGGM